MAKFSFDETIAKIRATPKGKEAAMYGPLRDVFVQVLEYPAGDVDIDVTGEGGRPDVTVRAPSGLTDGKGKPLKIDWVVVEAKDEPGCFLDEDSREAIFAKKAKYIGPHTAWFVMVDPQVIVFRPVAGGALSAHADAVLSLESMTEATFRHHASPLHFSKAGVSVQLQRFRAGDISLIAVEKLSAPSPTPSKALSNRIRTNRKRFFQQIREATTHLQQAVGTALARVEPQLTAFRNHADAFWTEFGRPVDAGEGFEAHSLYIRGRPEGPEASKHHDREAVRLRRDFARAPHLARLALRGLPEFQSRTGVEDEDLHELFAIETANLILARVMLLRFLEDHGFFGELRYVCNGGVDAFQKMRTYFKSSYARLLEQAYEEGSRLYASAFDETELDWIFGVKDEVLSSAIELTLFRFASYDFRTAQGDLLTGIYDRFMDRSQRKKLGEFYTPPSIAKFIVKRLGVGRDSRVLDPACGSGTFLIESYRTMVGDDVERGAADYSDVLAVFARLAGNDLNTFSAVLTQIQLLWQILALRSEIAASGFPDLRVTGKVNSLVERDLRTSLDRFAEIDQPEYDAVIGNPPYVRAERSAQALDARSQQEFERPRNGFPGISSKGNAFALFLYRALDRWCRPADANGEAGRVGFVLPVSLFDAEGTAGLRQLFRPGGRWAIREIIDLEVIYRQVFDADTLPAILIAENVPATPDDVVQISFADHSIVRHTDRDALPEFDLGSLPVSEVPYSDLFSPDGRILTRLTTRRLAILKKLWERDTLGDAAKPYWVRRKGSKVLDSTDVDPSSIAWERRQMLGSGVAFRAAVKKQAKGGPDVFKGENIIAGELQGDPAMREADMSAASDRGLWAYAALLPVKGYAVASVAHSPSAVAFDPRSTVFTNTAVVFFPQPQFAAVPFDLLLLSNVYVWFHALAARMGVLRTLRSHLYPSNLALLPWSARLAERAPQIESMRSEIVSACAARLSSDAALDDALDALALPAFKKHLQARADARVTWGDGFDDPVRSIEVTQPSVTTSDDGWRVQVSQDMFDSLECSDKDVAEGLVVALKHYLGRDFTRGELLALPIPVTDEQVARWQAALAAHKTDVLVARMDAALAALDIEVGHCLDLDPADLAEIQRDLREDPFLQRIRPRYPGTVTRKMGFRTGLDSAERYS